MKVFVGLSGGVDSAVSAALLKKAGHEVTGVFIKIWSPEFIECTSKEDRLDAMRVCAHLKIPFREIDLSREYRRRVIDSMLQDYQNGLTPNPDVLCNREIKFGTFFEWAVKEGAEKVATGHYARIRQVRDTCELLRAVDPGKDQTYFLYRLTGSELAKLLFPIGEYKKTHVRELAKEFDLPVAKKPDSQGLCFIGDVAMPDFLRRYLTVMPGNVRDRSGRIIGSHDGISLYTVGERRGLHITDPEATKKPQYVISLDARTNTVVVSADRSDAARTILHLDDVSWVNAPPLNEIVAVETRLRATAIRGTLVLEKGSYAVQLTEPVIAAAGQSAVLYQGEVCVGGGIVSDTVHTDAALVTAGVAIPATLGE